MQRFIDIFKQGGEISFTGMRNAALSLLPHDKAARNKLYEELDLDKLVSLVKRERVEYLYHYVSLQYNY